MADRRGIARMQHGDRISGELGNAVAVGLEIIDQEDVLDAERCAEITGVQRPWQIGELQPSIADRAGAAEARRRDL